MCGIISPLLVCLGGLVCYAIATNAKAQTLGLWSFVAGLHVTLMKIDGVALHVSQLVEAARVAFG